MRLTGILTIKDGIYLGYPFLEAVLSIMPIVDEFLINDGGSKDGSLEILKKLKKPFLKLSFIKPLGQKANVGRRLMRL